MALHSLWQLPALQHHFDMFSLENPTRIHGDCPSMSSKSNILNWRSFPQRNIFFYFCNSFNFLHRIDSVPLDIHSYTGFCIMVLVQFCTIWCYMEVLSSIASLHYACCRSVEVFLADFSMVLDSTRGIKPTSQKGRINIKKALIEVVDLHKAIKR